jgi:hypothetical protein
VRAAGLKRAEHFTWQRTAAEVVNVLESLPRMRATDSTTDTMQPHAPCQG